LSRPSERKTTIDALEAVRLGGTTQWIRLRGRDVSNPVLLLMQLGPGVPIINEARRFEQQLRLEEAFTVVYWDQRGTGLSLRDRQGPALTPERMVADTLSMLELLRDRFGSRPFVSGFSFGATFAAYAAARRPDLVASLVAVGMDIDVRAAEENAYHFALKTAHDRGVRRAVRQLESIGAPPHLDARAFATRVRWVTNFGGVTTTATYNGMLRELLVTLLRSPDYSIADVIRTLRGMTATQATLVPQLASTNLVQQVPRLEVPIAMVQGRRDQVAPGEVAERYYNSVTATQKELVWFERSAHTPHFEEPEKFREVLMAVRRWSTSAPNTRSSQP
jgi:pimeloyl-ACP methyl ester carboxylesterase